MAKKIIIADAGPLISFGRIKRLSLIVDTLGTIIAPVNVLAECLSNPAQAGAKEIQQAIDQKLIISHENPETQHHKNLFEVLGVGEASSIVLADQLKLGLLIDEKLGRNTAKKMNIPIIGTAGVLLLAKENNLIEKVTPIIQELRDSGYFLSKELIRTVLARANE